MRPRSSVLQLLLLIWTRGGDVGKAPWRRGRIAGQVTGCHALPRAVTARRRGGRGAQSRGQGWLPAPAPGFESGSPSEVASHRTLYSPTAETHIISRTLRAAARPSQESATDHKPVTRGSGPVERGTRTGETRARLVGTPSCRGGRTAPPQAGWRAAGAWAGSRAHGRRSQQRRGTASSGA